MKKILAALSLALAFPAMAFAQVGTKDMTDVRQAVIDILKKQNVPALAEAPAPQALGQPAVTAGKEIKLEFRNAPVKEVVSELARQSGINVIFSEIDESIPVSISYRGSNIREALDAVMQSGNVAYAFANNTYTISQFASQTFDIALLYETSFSLAGAAGSSGSSTTTTTTSSASTGSSVGDSTVSISSDEFTGYVSKVVDKIKVMLSTKGKIAYLPTGVLYVKDYPSYVRDIAEFLRKDEEKKRAVSLKIDLIRIDLKDRNQTGIDWNVLTRSLLSGGVLNQIKKISLGTNLSGLLVGSNVATIEFRDGNGNTDAFLKLLGEYGDVHVVHSWQSNAVTGTLLPFELTQTVWYSTGSTIQVINNQTITTPNVENREVGVKVRLLPVARDGRFLINTMVELSSITGTQRVGDLDFPSIDKNMVSVPIALRVGETATISGFKMRSETKKQVGWPILSKLPVLRYLFGYTEAQDQNSELVVVVSVQCPYAGSVEQCGK